MANYTIIESEYFHKKITSKKYAFLYKKILNYVYPRLRIEPHHGSNIKHLRGEFSDTLRFRIGNYQLFYKIQENKIYVLVFDIEHRQSAYR